MPTCSLRNVPSWFYKNQTHYEDEADGGTRDVTKEDHESHHAGVETWGEESRILLSGAY